MDYKEIKKLMDDMGNSKLEELEIEFPDGVKISMKKRKKRSNCRTTCYRSKRTNVCSCSKTTRRKGNGYSTRKKEENIK